MTHSWDRGRADSSDMEVVNRRTVLTAAALGLTGCVGSQNDDADDDPDQAGDNATANETVSAENTSGEGEDESDTDNGYTDVEDDVYNVEFAGSGEYRITADDSRIINDASTSLDLTEREQPEHLHPTDTDPEIYSKGVTDEGHAVVFYDEAFANTEPVRFYSTWTRGAHVEEVDEPKRKVLHEDAEIPDPYIDEVEDGLHKVTIPFDDLYENWDNLKKGVNLGLRIGHLGDTVIEKSGPIQKGDDMTYYNLTLSNFQFD